MIERIPDLPENILGFTAKGKVTAQDYERTLIPAVEKYFSQHDKIRFLYHLGEELSGFEAAAMWDDMKLGLQHFAGWERIAIVSDIEWIRSAIKLFGIVMPGDVRVFHNREFAEAKRWISE